MPTETRRGPALWPGRPFPLGATWDGRGTNFSLFSEHAQAVELCLFDEDGAEHCVPVEQQTALNWHCYIPDVHPGRRYAYRVHGPRAPEHGHRFDPDRLLIDPYAKAIDGMVTAQHVPKCVVIDPAFDWEGDALPQTPLAQSVIYEAHVRGFTRLMDRIPPELRGTYAGLASDEAIGYLRSLGVTAVELLPVHHIADEPFLAARGLTNYWGYSTIGYFAPHAGYAATGSRGEQVKEFKGMVKALHRAGIEVILDVVYNHTAEGGVDGPTLSFKGIDNSAYYRLDPDDPSRYIDFTGTGNSLNPVHPSVLRLIMDSLRYWVIECHVDGFRFDLAAALAREFYDVDRLSSFFDVIHQDPFLSQVKLIAEPWDVGPGGYQVGNFPVLWSEWNGIYRDTVRDFWRGRATRGDFAARISGSSDLYQSDGRHPFASINFVTAHDGYTLADLVSYERKHNEANQEDNRDGHDDNRSWNCGAEGPTDDPAINAVRARQQRNLATTLFVSQGTPMWLAGDECGRSQQGNNNAWCQDNELSWFPWPATDPQAQQSELLTFVRRLIALRAAHPVLRRERFLSGRELTGSGLPDAWWFRPDGRKLTRRDWSHGEPALGVFLNGLEIAEPGPSGERIIDDSFVLMFNAHSEAVTFRVPWPRFGSRWALELSTADPAAEAGSVEYSHRAQIDLVARSAVVLRRLTP